MPTVTFFLRLLFWFTARRLTAHPWRVAAVLSGIALGAAVFTSVRLAVDASLDSFNQSMDAISSNADWVIAQPGGRIREEIVKELLAHPLVETASPLITSYVQLAKDDAEPFLLIGMDPILDRSIRTWKITSSSKEDYGLWLDLIRIPQSILLGSRLTRKQDLVPGDTITLEHAQRVANFKLIGVLEPDGLALIDGGYVGLVDLSTMQEFTGLNGWVDRIDLRIRPGTKNAELEQLRNSLPPGMVLKAPTAMKEMGQAMINAYQLNLSLLSFVSLFVGMFLVYSLVALNAAARRHEVAILRSLGASSRLVFGLFLAEGGLLGVLGWFLAIPLGSFLVKYLLQGVSGTISSLFVRIRVDSPQLDGWEILLSFLVTLSFSLLAAFGPSSNATRVPPLEAMRTVYGLEGKKEKALLCLLLGLGFIALSWPISRMPGPTGLPLGGYMGVLFLFVGFSLISPWILQLIGAKFSSVLRKIAGEPAFLAARYVREAGIQTAVSVGALVTAMALFVALVVTVHSFRKTVQLWVDQSLNADLFLRTKMAGLNQYRDPLPGEVARTLKTLSEDVQVIPYRRIFLSYGKIPYQLEATDLGFLLLQGAFLMMEGHLEQVAPLLIAGEGVLVSEVFSNQTGLGVGSRYRAQLGDSVLDAPVLGIFRDYRTQGGAVFISLARLQTLTKNLEWSGARFYFDDRSLDMKSAVARLRSEILRRCGQKHPLEMASGTELRSEILRIFDETFAITTVLLLIALIVAGLGITTSLTVLVMERLRQLNTLVAVGASSRQIRSMVFWEAILMVTAGEGMGLACGFLLSSLLIYVINRDSFGWTFLYRVNWETLLLSSPLILATALIAALPAVRLVLKSSPALVLKEP